MLTLDELIVKPDEDLISLVEQRARLFLDRYHECPTHAFVTVEIYSKLLKEIAMMNRHSYVSPTQGVQHIQYNSSFGTIGFIVVKGVRNFLMIGVHDTYDNHMNNFAIPPELWSNSTRIEFDKEFEKIVLDN